MKIFDDKGNYLPETHLVINRIFEEVVDIFNSHTNLSPRELAYLITDFAHIKASQEARRNNE